MVRERAPWLRLARADLRAGVSIRCRRGCIRPPALLLWYRPRLSTHKFGSVNQLAAVVSFLSGTSGCTRSKPGDGASRASSQGD
jgi:hypothetical protein